MYRFDPMLESRELQVWSKGCAGGGEDGEKLVDYIHSLPFLRDILSAKLSSLNGGALTT